MEEKTTDDLIHFIFTLIMGKVFYHSKKKGSNGTHPYAFDMWDHEPGINFCMEIVLDNCNPKVREHYGRLMNQRYEREVSIGTAK